MFFWMLFWYLTILTYIVGSVMVVMWGGSRVPVNYGQIIVIIIIFVCFIIISLFSIFDEFHGFWFYQGMSLGNRKQLLYHKIKRILRLNWMRNYDFVSFSGTLRGNICRYGKTIHKQYLQLWIEPSSSGQRLHAIHTTCCATSTRHWNWVSAVKMS